jgi:hypothetical protein
MRSLLFLLFCLLFIGESATAQTTLSGKVIDANTHEALAFVNVVILPASGGTSTDIDGRFYIRSQQPVKRLQFTYVGYEPLILEVTDKQEFVVKLKRKNLQLAEVRIFPGLNPADRIIQRASENRNSNNPEKNTSFAYTSYNKFYVTADFKADGDSSNSLDTARRTKTRAQKFFDRQHVFLTESVSKRKFMHPDRNHEEVIASRTSGLKTPLFTALGTQMQSFSFYNSTIKLFDRAYMNPLVSGSTNKYLFIIEDTLYNGRDSTFVLSFRPKRGKKFDGLKGLIYINSNQYAVQNVIAEPDVTEGLFTIRIQQKYELKDGTHWFPAQLNTDLYYNDFSIMDTVIVVSADAGKKAGEGNNAGKLKIVSRSYIRDIVLNPPLRKGEFGSLEVEVAPDAGSKDEAFWNTYRADSLTQRDRRTYHVVDSMGKADNLDLKINALSALIDGQLPWKYVCFDLNRLVGVNDYEKFRAGMGLHTSDRVSGYYTVGGYAAYGFGDKQLKYGCDFSIFPYRKNRDYALSYAYSHDIVESAGIGFFREFAPLNEESFRTELLSVFDRQDRQQISICFRTMNYFLCNIYVSDETRIATNAYRYGYSFENGAGSASWNQFGFTEAGLQLKFIYREKFSEFLGKRISDGSDYPVVFGNVIKGFDNIRSLSGNFDYTKYEFKIFKKFVTAKVGKPSFELLAGYVQGNLPYTKLFAGRGSFVNYSITVPNTFETMGTNEFLSDRYVALFYTHDFGRLFIRKKHFQPQVLFQNKVGFGSLSNTANHFDVAYKTMERGYFETGLLLNNILRRHYLGFGAGLFYRYGAYAFAQEGKNVAVKFSLTFNF